jgi:hypothetical protein
MAALGMPLLRSRDRRRKILPKPESSVSGTKAKHKLVHRHAYLVEEAKPDFAMRIFSDTLKGRCHDCEDDESFTCESLTCSECSLPCPCKGCKKYRSRTQGLMITRQYPKDVRTSYYLQTTPIIWLSSVQGDENMDPAKLSLLSDFLVAFMERSQNGMVLVDGIEYLVTSNDFARVLRAVDRWTEATMTSTTRLIITIDPRAFEPRDLAMLERNKEVVRPGETEPWKIIPEPI